MPAAVEDGRPVRWGILGAGRIADALAADIGRTDGNQVVAVGARDAGRAAAFAARHGAARSYGSYEALVADDEVDVVYVSTTHPHHRPQALLAVAAGRAVVVEKPFGLNAAEAREVFAAARQAGVFAMEAMWMRANPLVRQVEALVGAGEIGEVRNVRFELGIGAPYDPGHRLYDIDNGGGALLDLGVYTATLAYLLLGRPDEVRTTGSLAPNGVDDTVAMQWLYAGAPRAQLWCSLSAAGPITATVMGTAGWVVLEPPAYRPTGLIVHTDGRDHRVEDPLAAAGRGYGPQVEEVARCLRAGLAESELIPWADTVAILEILDSARRELGVAYPSEGRAG
jgi:predicted dehydrogenase